MSITGNLRTLELAELLQWLAQGQKTGALVVENGELEKRIYFRSGKIVCSESNNPEEHLGGFLVREGLIDEATLSRAFKLQESTQILLGKVLVTLGSISEDELHQILHRKTEESIYELFTWSEGEFHFVPDELPEQSMATLELEVTNVVLEGMKRLDEARRDAQEETAGGPAPEAGDFGQTAADGYDPATESESEELEIPAVELAEGDLGSFDDEGPGGGEGLYVDREPSSEVRGYYGERLRTTQSTPLLAAAAVAGVLAVGALVYFFFLRPEPVVGVADRTTLESSAELEAPVPEVETDRPGLSEPVLLDSGAVTLGEPLEETSEPEESPAPEPAPATAPDRSEELQARYETELAALRQELQRTKLVAAERKAAVRMLKADEVSPEPQLVELTPFETLEPETELVDSAVLGSPPQQAAGGDEPPTLAGTIAARDNPAGPSAGLAEEPGDAPADPEPDLVQPAAAIQAGGAVAPGPGVTPPQLLANPQPRYPPAALRVGKQADVTVRLLIGEDGRVREVERVGPLAGMGFDQAALMAARRTSWRPATKDGMPVKMWTELRIAFRP